MRQRLLSPGFFTNEELTVLPPLARLTFAGLWCAADKAGRVEDRPRRLKVLLLPYEPLTDAEFDALLASLASGGFIRRYEVAGERYLQVVSWKKHQRPHPKEKASVIPEPPASSEKVRPGREKDVSSNAGPSVPSGSSGSSGSSGIAVPAPPAPRIVPKPTGVVRNAWSREAADDWIAAYDGQPTGAYFKALEPLVKRETWERVRPVLRYYLAATVPEFVNVSKFAAQFGSWEARQQGRHPPGTPAASDKARRHKAAAEAFIRGGLLEDGGDDAGTSLDQGHGAVAGLLQGPRDGR